MLVTPLHVPREPIGLLAGWGRFPLVFAEKARSLGLPVVCVGIRGEADPCLKDLTHQFHWTGVARLGRMIRLFKSAGVREIVMAGKIHKQVMFQPWRWLRLLPDLRTVRFWLRRWREGNNDDSLLLAMIDEFAGEGMMFRSALDYCPELLVRPGVLTRRQPTPAERADIAFGWRLAKEIGRLDIGQSVAVKERAVLAVEAIEGTDRMILRAGDLCRAGNFTVVKVAKPHQDMRFDVPTIGPWTLESMRRAGARVLAVEAGKTIILDEAEAVAKADDLGLVLAAFTDAVAELTDAA